MPRQPTRRPTAPAHPFAPTRSEAADARSPPPPAPAAAGHRTGPAGPPPGATGIRALTGRRRGPRPALFASLAWLLATLLLGSTRAAARPNGDHPDPSRPPPGIRVVATRRVAARQVDLTVASAALGRTARVRLLTPDGWRPGDGRHWPTLWLLHGCCDDYTSWTAKTDLARLPALRRVLVVMPEGGTAGFYSDWLAAGTPAGSATGAVGVPAARRGGPGWETFHLAELLPLLERSYGAGPDRAVAGLSMGGFGALSYAARHPGAFRAAASFSGVADPLYEPGGRPDGPDNVRSIVRGQGLDPDALWGDPVAGRAVWLAHDPYPLAPALLGIPLFLSCGDGDAGPYDPPGTHSDYERLFLAENLRLAGRLRALADGRLVTDFYGPGTHSWPYWQRELHRALPLLLAAMRVPAG